MSILLLAVRRIKCLPSSTFYSTTPRSTAFAFSLELNRNAAFNLFSRPLEQVARDSVIERLVDRLMARNPQAMDYLNMKSGTATVALANALMDWRDEWVAR